jgi:hypothetical protein
MNKTICFYDIEATSVSRDADIISIGLVAVTKSLDFNFQFNDKDYPENELLYYLEDFLELNCENWYRYSVNYYEILDQKPSDTIRFSISDAYYQIPHTVEQGKQHLIDVVIPKIKECLSNHFTFEPTIKTFYSEFTDYSLDKCDQWVRENVIGKLKYPHAKTNCVEVISDNRMNLEMTGETEMISGQLKEWLSQFESVKFWADYDVIDKPMLIDLIADWDTKSINTHYEGLNNVWEDVKIGLPKHLPNINYYDFYDLNTFFLLKGIDPNINREDFVSKELTKMSVYGKDFNTPPFDTLIGEKHNALWDAYISYLCYENLMRL